MTLIDKNKPTIIKCGEYTLNLLKWTVLSVLVGTICGMAGVLFHFMVDEATHIREQHPQVLYLLPLAGIVIVFLYRLSSMEDDKGTNAIITSVRSGKPVTIKVAPLIIVSTALTHFAGGSSGREGAALQIGGSISGALARLLKLKTNNTAILIMCGMSAVFSAVFGTPLTAAVFSLEVVSVGIMHYGALFPSVLSALTAHAVALAFKVSPTSFVVAGIPHMEIGTVMKVIILSALAAIVSIVFIYAMHESSNLFKKYIKNSYLRIITGSALIILLTLILGSYDYNGAGMGVINNALENGIAEAPAFLLKIVFTAITLSSGFKGGEIVPTFFIGATFGVLGAQLVGLNPSFGAAIGLIALFCGVVNCPVASILLSVELFGSEGVIYFAIAAAVSYIFSGNYSLYSAQKIMYSKLHAVFVNNG